MRSRAAAWHDNGGPHAVQSADRTIQCVRDASKQGASPADDQGASWLVLSL